MKEKMTYPNIDMRKTGLRLKRLLTDAGYTPKLLQRYLQLSCPQPIYRWYKGQILPSVDHLLMLSELLGVHMEELLVKKEPDVICYEVECVKKEKYVTRYMLYYGTISRSVS